MKKQNVLPFNSNSFNHLGMGQNNTKFENSLMDQFNQQKPRNFNFGFNEISNFRTDVNPLNNSQSNFLYKNNAVPAPNNSMTDNAKFMQMYREHLQKNPNFFPVKNENTFCKQEGTEDSEMPNQYNF